MEPLNNKLSKNWMYMMESISEGLHDQSFRIV